MSVFTYLLLTDIICTAKVRRLPVDSVVVVAPTCNLLCWLGLSSSLLLLFVVDGHIFAAAFLFLIISSYALLLPHLVVS